ncbi:MAG: ImmA/IrrE family metallo-endopeptidase [Gammaproteobacteria bacterium]|nr:ImmA/IrrE family metallo-endopeptidase [Gammaproteobacteria bacterium]
MPRVNPEILVWARETAGLSIDEAAAKLGISKARGIAAATRLSALETGVSAPSRTHLSKMAKLYRRPLLTFYMSAPPRKGDRGQDFRTLPDRQTEAEPLVDALIRDIRARQSMVRTIIADDEEVAPLRFIGSMKMDEGVGTVLASIRQILSFDLATFRAQGSPEAAFSLLRAKIEAVGVFVLLVGNLGSHHTTLDVATFRGFALADPIAPFVVINDQDAKSAWSFTLLHELAHLWLGATGVSGQFTDMQLERFCNDVASNFLLPGNELNLVGVDQRTDQRTAATQISLFAKDRLLSRTMVAYRLFRAELLSEKMWQRLRSQFESEWRQSRAAQRERNREQDGGPDYYVVRRHRLGSALLSFVARNMSEGSLTPTKAGKLLGVKARSVHPLLSGAALSIGQAA